MINSNFDKLRATNNLNCFLQTQFKQSKRIPAFIYLCIIFYNNVNNKHPSVGVLFAPFFFICLFRYILITLGRLGIEKFCFHLHTNYKKNKKKILNYTINICIFFSPQCHIFFAVFLKCSSPAINMKSCWQTVKR